MRRVRMLALSAAVLLLSFAPAAAQWTTLGDMPAPARSGNTVTFTSKQGVVAVTVLSPEILRVRFAPVPKLGRDHSYAIVTRDFGDPRATIAYDDSPWPSPWSPSAPSTSATAGLAPNRRYAARLPSRRRR